MIVATQKHTFTHAFDPAEYAYSKSVYFPDTNKCQHCGATYNYGAVYKHNKGDVINVGHICAETHFSYPDRAALDLDILKKQVAQAREAEKLVNTIQEFLDTNPGLGEALETNHHISADLKAKLGQWGSLSPKQVELVFKLQKQVADKAVAEAAKGPRADCPKGRVQVTGTVLSTKVVEGQFGTQIKCLVEDDSLFKVWGTAPASLLAITDQGLRGCRVTFSGELEPSQDDPKFGFFKRPTKPALLACPVHAND